MNEKRKSHGLDTPVGRLGTFSGVFTPSILTILGIILFLRLGYVVGNAGLKYSLIIVALANTISVLTTFSLAAISTNIKVKVGGPYYIISRTLGPEFGGSIGIVLFLAQSISIGFYCIGFGEAVASIIPYQFKITSQIIAGIAVLFLFIFAWLGADWSTKFQYVVMCLLVIALLSFFVGGANRWDISFLTQNWSGSSPDQGFWILFAIFFPAVTGFTQGVSMSGDLKDPGRSIPNGTFLAVGISIIVYFGSSILFAATLSLDTLANDYYAMKKVSLYGPLVDAGVIAATLSSAMASFLGAPRILQSLSTDRIFPFLSIFSKGYGVSGNPRRGVLLSALISFAIVGLGKLNLVAPVVSMFFLISYGLLNLATYYEASSISPSFRPRFRWYYPKLSLLGCIACLCVMLAIDLKSSAIAIAVLLAIYQYLKRTAGPARWADSRRSYHLQRARENLLAASSEIEHQRDWRPQILAFSNDPAGRERLLRFSSWLEGGSGLTTAVKILEGEGVRMLKLRKEAEAELKKDISQYHLKSFPLVLTAPNLQIGIQTLIQSFGIGPMKANIVVLNWVEDLHKGILGLGEFRFINNLRVAFRQGCNIILLDLKDDLWNSLDDTDSSEKTIDVWWWDDSTSKLMLLLAYLMTKDKAWDDAKIRVLAVDYDKESGDPMEELQKALQEIRISAEPEIVENADLNSIIEHSSGSTLVFLPFRIRDKRLRGPFDGDVEGLLSRLSLVALVLAAEDIDLEAEPEEGKAGELAAALDALTDAENRAKKARKAAEKAAEKAQDKIEALEAEEVNEDDELIKSKIEDSLKAKKEAEKAARRAAKALAKAKDAADEAEKLGADQVQKEEILKESEE